MKKSLLLAAIVLSNCITWTASRHHYAHNVHQHRTRHRRQGAGLYLPASYVIPGGEGSGPWGDWGEISPCSRTCGGGVASQKRICLEPGPQNSCTGGDTKYFSCQTQDCPAGSGDFRAEQCAEFDDKEFRGFKYNWVPYTKAPNPCELNCMPHAERFYFRHKLQVVDGTRLLRRVRQRSLPVRGEDKCRECRGNGTNCHTMEGLFDSQDLLKGYNDILLIPEGSTTIIIEEIEPSNNYLALRAKNGTYYLNGHYHIDFPRSIMIAGALWTYERSQQGFPAPDKLRCLGPITEPLYLSLLLQDVNVGIKYEYSIPNNSTPPTDKQYNWVHEEFTPCSATCGGGFQTRNVTCRSREELEVVDNNLCDEGLKPPMNQSCNQDPCPAQWVAGPWGDCSKRCGSGGVRSREVTCQKVIANGIASIVPEKECFELLGPKPELFQKCNEDAPCPDWFVGHWKPCDKLCDEGKQTRQVVCRQKINGRVTVLGDGNCTDEKPAVEQKCMIQPCDGVDWVTSDWSGCDTCFSKLRTRSVTCATKGHQVLNDSFCTYHNRPVEQEECDEAKLPPCEVQWYATQWSKCSVECGDGVQTRKVFCGLLSDDSVEKVEDSKCAHLPKYNDTKPCSVPKEKCPSQWFTGPWSECTKECGGGEQFRRVMCLRGNEEAFDCPADVVLDSTQFCNTGPCNKDDLLPVDKLSTVIMDDDDDYCDEDVEMEEAGLDFDLTDTTVSLKLKSYAEHEVSLDAGSGFSSLSTDDLTTDEGSGFSSASTDTSYHTEYDDDGSGETSVKPSGSTLTTIIPSLEPDLVASISTKLESSSTITDSTSSDTESETGSTPTGVTEETSSTDESSTDSTGSTESTETGSISSDETGATSSTEATKDTDSTGSTVEASSNATESDSTSSDETSDSSATEATTKDTTGSTEEGDTSSTESSRSTDVKETGSTEATSSAASESTGTSDTSSSTDESSTEVSTSNETGVTTPTGETDSTVTEETSGTENTGSTESTVTGESSSTESESTDTSSATESSPTDTTSATESTVTEESTPLESTITEHTDTAGTTDASELSTDSDSTDTDNTTEDLSTTGLTTTPVPKDTEETTTPKESSTEPTSETGSTSEVESTTAPELTTGGSDSTTEESGATTEESGSTTVKSDSTTVESAVESSSLAETTAEEGSTEVVSSTTGGETTVETTGSSLLSGSTEESSTASGSESTGETTSNTVSGSETITESSESSTEQSTTESSDTASTESTAESSTLAEGSTGSETSTISDQSTTVESGTEETTGLSGLTTTEEPTTEGVITTKLSWQDVLKSNRTCKPRRKPKCNKTKFGCCPDNKTAALGPFDEGCLKPRTCKESRHGCCPDGVSPKLGATDEGCPVEPCADTLFGCCLSDNKTAAQGNDQEGCPPPPPACASSKFGCCADNETEATGPKKAGCPETETSTTGAGTDVTTESVETGDESTTGADTTAAGTTELGGTTLELCSSFEFGCCADNQTEAKGPDGQGCPCNATEFGCCPDGVSPAKGTGNEGCPGPCSTSPHGCCQDNKTPAHGPDFEGCCLLQAFGCCPDNRKPAEGPHLEGCGCQYSLHGCCPDNVTIAQGADNQGCGCQYTQHGCCPDRHTAASGPDNEGCGCSTFQFGCCPDGVTIAKGPEQQGCHCHYSLFGCCGDGETPATGPDSGGCDCSTSKYGCCPDGITLAAGPKFLGCTDVPENKQVLYNVNLPLYQLPAACRQTQARVITLRRCDACNLPSVKGACDGSYEHWHYNSTREQCVPFLYGGCLGNANNFESRELCQKQCEPKTVEGQCDLPIEQGSCAGNFSRWGFNPDTRSCEQFIWGGCEGNANRFSTEAACQMRCNPPGSQPPQCAEPQEAGSCDNKEALWSFSVSENRCVPFYYSGCGGNNNRFPSREACEQTCPAAYVPDKCTLPAETGQCSNYRERWFFDTTFKRCRQFYYGGCGGNENNFATEAECENSPAEPQPQPGPQVPSRSDFCFLEIDAGPCNDMQTRFAYDSKLGRCVTFQYGGCAGNQNNFPDLEYCTFYCHPIQDICQLPMLAGPCDDSQMRWFYDPSSDTCSQFTYGGCEGNENRFETREACESRCKTGPVPAATTPSTTVAVGSRFGEDFALACKVTDSLEECQQGGLVWYYDPEQRECVSHSNRESGAVCRHTGTFTSQEACERSCGAFRGVDVCKQSVDPGPCQSYMTKVYFDTASGQCREFSYGGCLGGANRFSTIEECNQVCETAVPDPCILPPETGTCSDYIVQWYYDPARDQCNQFAFTGCGGNTNRFETRRDCESRCKRPEPRTTTEAPQPQPQAEPECKTPSSLEPCGNNVTVFYYDAERRQCLVSGFGGCGHPNSYSTEEECERNCGAFRGQDVCGAPLDPGPCRASIPKIYWDEISGSCQPYAYGGCNGGPNRFSNIEECESVCGGTGPAPECLQAVDTGEGCGVAAAQRWHYSVAHVDCVVFVYLGCGGNDNNFRSYDECAAVCGLSRSSGRDDQNQIAVPDCTAAQQQCEGTGLPVRSCQIHARWMCECSDDPCVRANCSSNERCVAVAVRNPAYQEPQYSATCVEETNEVDDCEEYAANCSRLRCEYNIQRTRMPNGCEKCSCVQLEVDCQPLLHECETIKCNYGIQKSIGADGCQRCSCKEYPCAKKTCPPGDRCVVIPYNDGLDLVTKYTADCRTVTKPGFCPTEETTTNEVTCRHECYDDADCRGVGKCCRRGCSDLCLVPVEQTSPPPVFNATLPPDVPAPPQALPQQEPQVAASEGGKATLRCLFHGNPPPKITWKYGELTVRMKCIDVGRRAGDRVSYRNDSGVYICVADNGLGIATQEIHLVVNDPVRAPVGIAGDENAVVTGELGSPLTVRCLAYGYPPPTVFWYRGYDGTMVPYNDAVFEARGNVLLIRSLAIETLGQYTCQAYNGEGKAASWVVNVRAYRPEGLFIENDMLVPRGTPAPRPRTPPPTTKELTTTTTTTEARIPVYTVPVSAHVSSRYSTLKRRHKPGAHLRSGRIPGPRCLLDEGRRPSSAQRQHPYYCSEMSIILLYDVDVLIYWSRLNVCSEVVSRLTVQRVKVSDSGLYACHASNLYTSQTDTAQVNVQQLLVPAKCTDNPFFANCDLIVRSKFCRHKYYSKFCCKSCVEAGQLDPQEAELQADQPLKKK
ncbi:hypothetical protein HW555_008335 [Spodoptera exigua]|uniref:Papilin n=1 Tax=Spodoptera exigua TaxID=7107 RepID=A0A835L1U2_SPOEX|nr:hypothetical protein HW555_008335 [Spodoptera exigua]